MSLWPRIRDEVAGAWRSVGYDLGRRTPGAAASPGDPDVTSTGMTTFPGSLIDLPSSPPRTDARPPRRFVAVTAFCLLALLGAAGSYLIATSIFSSPRGVVPEAVRQPAAQRPIPVDQTVPGTDPTAPAATRNASPAAPPMGEASTGGTGSTAATGNAPTAGKAPASASGPASAADPAIPATSRHPRPVAVAPEKTRRTGTPCGTCHTPPVPTPTAPSPAGPAGPTGPIGPPTGASPSPSGPGTPAQPSGNPDTSPDPGTSGKPSASPSQSPSSGGGGHHHRRSHLN
ncbi:hypothetical protein AB0F72_39505 [Actinoplanes sp. NPDC023936]|uniref:hypothetical protein n=1 Tax=Actinoplanes sp. NPDC023936 TaxID=3154910 RepID=UPI00340C8333